LFKNFTAQV